jgi:hypothetical protein
VQEECKLVGIQQLRGLHAVCGEGLKQTADLVDFAHVFWLVAQCAALRRSARRGSIISSSGTRDDSRWDSVE